VSKTRDFLKFSIIKKNIKLDRFFYAFEYERGGLRCDRDKTMV